MVVSNITSVVLDFSKKIFVDNPLSMDIIKIDPSGKYAILKGVANIAALSGVVISTGYLYYKGELTREVSSTSFTESWEIVVSYAGMILSNVDEPRYPSNKTDGLQKISNDLFATTIQFKLQILKKQLDAVLNSGSALIEGLKKDGDIESEQIIKYVENQMQKYKEEYLNILGKFSPET